MFDCIRETAVKSIGRTVNLVAGTIPGFGIIWSAVEMAARHMPEPIGSFIVAVDFFATEEDSTGISATMSKSDTLKR